MVSVLEPKLILKTKKEWKQYQILKEIITASFDSSFLLFPLCWYYLACFCTFKKKNKKQPLKVFKKKLLWGLEGRWIWTNVDIVIKGRWNEKQKKVSWQLQSQILHLYMFIYFLSMFLFLMRLCFKRKRFLQLPHVMLYMELTIFSPWIPFCGKIFLTT